MLGKNCRTLHVVVLLLKSTFSPTRKGSEWEAPPVFGIWMPKMGTHYLNHSKKS